MGGGQGGLWGGGVQMGRFGLGGRGHIPKAKRWSVTGSPCPPSNPNHTQP